MKSWKIPFYTAAALCAVGFSRSGYANLYIAAKDMPTYCERVFDPKVEINPEAETAPNAQPNQKAREDLRAELRQIWQTLAKTINPFAPASFEELEKAAVSGKKNDIVDKAFAGLEARLAAAEVHDSVGRVLYDLKQSDPEYQPEDADEKTNAVRRKLNAGAKDSFERYLTRTSAFLIGVDAEKLNVEGADILKKHAKNPMGRLELYRALQKLTESQRQALLLAAEMTKTKNRGVNEFSLSRTPEDVYGIRKAIAILKSLKQQVFFMKSDSNFQKAILSCQSLCKNTSKHLAEIGQYQSPQRVAALEAEYHDAVKQRFAAYGEGKPVEELDKVIDEKYAVWTQAAKQLKRPQGQSVDIGLEFWVGDAHRASYPSNKVDPMERHTLWENAVDAAEEHQTCMGSGYVEGVKGVGTLFWTKLWKTKMVEGLRCHDTAPEGWNGRAKHCQFKSVAELEKANSTNVAQTETLRSEPREAPELLGAPKKEIAHQ